MERRARADLGCVQTSAGRYSRYRRDGAGQFLLPGASDTRQLTVCRRHVGPGTCQEARATAIPGSTGFTQYAEKRGVTVFYITNRTANVEDATRRNLGALGFPLTAGIDTVLTRAERPEWQASAKGARRAHVARDYRIVLLVGDDLGDFVVDASGTSQERAARAAPQADWWGRRWIMLPNPTYGSWERAIIGNGPDPIAAKRRALKW